MGWGGVCGLGGGGGKVMSPQLYLSELGQGGRRSGCKGQGFVLSSVKGSAGTRSRKEKVRLFRVHYIG